MKTKRVYHIRQKSTGLYYYGSCPKLSDKSLNRFLPENYQFYFTGAQKALIMQLKDIKFFLRRFINHKDLDDCEIVAFYLATATSSPKIETLKKNIEKDIIFEKLRQGNQ